MKRKGVVSFWIILVLAAIGLYRLFSEPSVSWILPLAIVAVVAALYFLLPKARRAGGSYGGRGNQPKVKPSARTQEKLARMSSGSSKPTPARAGKTPPPKKRKSYPFQVIEGRKGKDEEDVPKFH
ncbi:hypothetical protein QWJ34_07095 [Saccharibacillus sp. CPCC 101409]|uniref:hypothetical protein n=1 Tax=Saccharibacillus sp. CPCC 101409 TaxID=3058041 RepID=UPI00267396AD|nr:hypothetical protein [Saccharibacillus sp. CPCC 101409]MDO3409525.1 hypothetical protein [Saccharibacillus sp. CPCC 101409]